VRVIHTSINYPDLGTLAKNAKGMHSVDARDTMDVVLRSRCTVGK